MLILLTPPGLVGALMFGYFELGWHRMKKDSELDEQRLEERIVHWRQNSSNMTGSLEM
jgi:hypothetical protein